MWRVTNTDEAAALENALHGGFEKPEADYRRWEHLSIAAYTSAVDLDHQGERCIEIAAMDRPASQPIDDRPSVGLVLA